MTTISAPLGIYNMTKIESENDLGLLTEAPFTVGRISFAQDGIVSLIQESAGKTFSYIGQTRITDGNKLSIGLLVCSNPDLVGRIENRIISVSDGTNLVLEGIGFLSNVAFRITWVKV
jgi:hypothetical protein